MTFAVCDVYSTRSCPCPQRCQLRRRRLRAPLPPRTARLRRAARLRSQQRPRRWALLSPPCARPSTRQRPRAWHRGPRAASCSEQQGRRPSRAHLLRARTRAQHGSRRGCGARAGPLALLVARAHLVRPRGAQSQSHRDRRPRACKSCVRNTRVGHAPAAPPGSARARAAPPVDGSDSVHVLRRHSVKPLACRPQKHVERARTLRDMRRAHRDPARKVHAAAALARPAVARPAPRGSGDVDRPAVEGRCPQQLPAARALSAAFPRARGGPRRSRLAGPAGVQGAAGPTAARGTCIKQLHAPSRSTTRAATPSGDTGVTGVHTSAPSSAAATSSPASARQRTPRGTPPPGCSTTWTCARRQRQASLAPPKDETCPVSTGGRTRRVRLVRGEGGKRSVGSPRHTHSGGACGGRGTASRLSVSHTRTVPSSDAETAHAPAPEGPGAADTAVTAARCPRSLQRGSSAPPSERS